MPEDNEVLTADEAAALLRVLHQDSALTRPRGVAARREGGTRLALREERCPCVRPRFTAAGRSKAQ